MSRCKCTDSLCEDRWPKINENNQSAGWLSDVRRINNADKNAEKGWSIQKRRNAREKSLDNGATLTYSRYIGTWFIVTAFVKDGLCIIMTMGCECVKKTRAKKISNQGSTDKQAAGIWRAMWNFCMFYRIQGGTPYQTLFAQRKEGSWAPENLRRAQFDWMTKQRETSNYPVYRSKRKDLVTGDVEGFTEKEDMEIQNGI